MYNIVSFAIICRWRFLYFFIESYLRVEMLLSCKKKKFFSTYTQTYIYMYKGIYPQWTRDSSKLLSGPVIKLFFMCLFFCQPFVLVYTRESGRYNISDYGQSFPAKDPITVAIRGLCGFRFQFNGPRILLLLCV